MARAASSCLVGQVLVDVTLLPGENKLRLGGVMHAARAMWALGQPYELAYTAPNYLVPLVEEFAKKHRAKECTKIGDVQGCPNVILIPEPTEAGSQGYELLLRDSQKVMVHGPALSRVVRNRALSDVLIFPGGFSLRKVLKAFSASHARVSIDVAYDVPTLQWLQALRRKFETVFTSTSSDLFIRHFNADVTKLSRKVLQRVGKTLVFKENRGGARLYERGSKPIHVDAQVRPIAHSVGVGDCFDVAFLTLKRKHGNAAAMAYASAISAEYACTTYPDDFKTGAERVLLLSTSVVKQLRGVRVPWDTRPRIEVYIAAPDFDYVDRAPIEAIAAALTYHNFTAHRPVLEHGQTSDRHSGSIRRRIYQNDMELLRRCDILLAVLLHDDPGTLIEIGMASERKMPVIIYDPYHIAKNLVLQNVPNTLTDSLDAAISGVFVAADRLLRGRAR
jgi:nucleoside 2-deoxyribosyltransferase